VILRVLFLGAKRARARFAIHFLLFTFTVACVFNSFFPKTD
jgi:hypothetical protein